MGALDDFFGRLSILIQNDRQFHEDAYLFVMAGLGRAGQRLKASRHVTGAELLESLRLEGLDQFGPMAGEVFRHWGIKNSLDFGKIVFKMVDQQILAKTDQDRLEDFEDPLFFERLFDEDAIQSAVKLKGSLDG